MAIIRKYGPNEIENSSLCFGTMQFGDGADEKDSQEMYEACRNSGINFFDTAYVYTGGKSELILGKLISKDRDNIILITKAGSVGGSSGSNIRTQLEDSLRRLNQDYVDIFFLHHWDDNIALEETFETLKELKEEKKFFQLGVSNFSAWQVMKAKALAEKYGFPNVDILQPMYNLVKRQAEVEILPMAKSENIGVISYSPLGGGLLTGKYETENNTSNKNTSGRLHDNAKYKLRYGQSWMYEAASKLQKLAEDINYDPIALAVAWVSYNDAITAPIISARNLKQLKPSLDSVNINLDEATYNLISQISPTPPPATDRLEETSH
ncbi:aldo/keto reductase [Pseudomonadota bacterium]|jgi:aryl-alcohol dehydrogenase-like predicted oxidoreductase|nr:aldo/keto reductase [Pseudomonadota bacterium]|tara:strand:- start:9 stop:977 length:969 start_codon:yes stop_codon:yes gene_type:complete